MSARRTLTLLGGITVAALALRVVGLDQGLWYDEIVTLVESVRPPLATILTAFPGANNHPLYSVAGHLAVHAFGEHAWSLRLPAVLFGVAGVPALFWLGVTVAGRREALGAAALLAVSYHHVWFSQNARGYTALLFWTLLASVAFIKGLQDRRRGWYVLHGLAIALGMYTHLTMAFVAAAHGVIWCAQVAGLPRAGTGRLDWRGPALAVATAAGVTGLLYAPTFLEVYGTFGGPPPAAREVATPRWAIWELLAGLRVGFGTLGAVAGLALGGWGAWSYLRSHPVAFAVFTLPAVVTGAGILLLRFPVRPRFFFGLIGFAVLFIVRGALCAGGEAARRLVPRVSAQASSVAGTTLVAAVIVASLVSLPRAYARPKQDFDGALRFIDASRAPDEPVLTGGLARYPYRRLYGRRWTEVVTRGDLRAVGPGARRVWMVYSFPEYMDRELVDVIRRGCRPARVFPGTLGGGDVHVCTFEGSPGGAGGMENFDRLFP